MAIWPWTRKKRRSHAPLPEFSTTAPHTTEMFERHVGLVDLEEAAKRSRKAKGPKNLSMAWDATALGGLAARDLVDDREKKDTYYKVYCGNQWVSGCVGAIAKRMTSGGWECVEVEKGKGKKGNKRRIEDLLLLDNLEEDILQMLRSIVTDKLVFGEAFCELGFSGGTLSNLYMIDGITMTTHFDKHGVVTGYTQRLEKSTDTVQFEPREIVRWWLPDPRAKKKALSPIELLKDPVWLDRNMVTWGERFFRQGGKPSYWVEMGPDSDESDATRYIEWYKENYTGVEAAHIPVAMYSGSKIHEYGKGSIELDFAKSEDKQRDRVLVVYGVPPAMLNIIESGNIGGGTGESQNKAFIYNTVAPIEQLIMEKFNYRVVRQGMAITDWKVATRHADYRDDKEIADIEDKGLKNGSLTINEARQGRGRESVPGGDVPVMIAGNAITPVSRLETMAQEQTDAAQTALDKAKADADKAKEPPQPVPAALQQGAMPEEDEDEGPEDKEESVKRRFEEQLRRGLCLRK